MFAYVFLRNVWLTACEISSLFFGLHLIQYKRLISFQSVMWLLVLTVGFLLTGKAIDDANIKYIRGIHYGEL